MTAEKITLHELSELINIHENQIRYVATQFGLGRYAWLTLQCISHLNKEENEVESIIEVTQLPPSRISEAIRELESGGFLQTRAHSIDRRRIVVTLTDRGVVLYDMITKDAEKNEESILALSQKNRKPSGFSQTEYRILLALSEQDYASNNEICEQLSISQSTASNCLSRLLGKKMIEVHRTENRSNKRCYYKITKLADNIINPL